MKTKHLWIASAITLLLLSPSHALAERRDSLPLPMTKLAPTIDGDLNDPCWKDALKAGAFARFTGGAPVVENTEAWATTDGKTLYVAFRCHDSRPELIRASETQRGSGAVYGDDHITVLIDSQHQHRGASAFSINPIGTLYHTLEGGTADNITWAGDWKGAAKRDDKGWSCELAIPFGLMRHPARAKAFGMQLIRSLNRESNFLIWPSVPPEGQSVSTLAQYMPDITLSQPMPDAAPKPVFLPYALATASTKGQKARVGLDVKYPFSTTLTGLLAVKPDFQTIENDVASVNFSYNEQFVADRRPFFAEGSEFLPDPELFYSRRIDQFDAGAKIVGRNGNTSVGFVGTNARSTKFDRDAMALSVKQAVGLFSEYGVSATGDDLHGIVRNQTARVHGAYGWVSGQRRNTLYVRRTQSWVGAQPKGTEGVFYLGSSANNGRPSFTLVRSTLEKDFVSTLGLLQDPDRKTWSASTTLRNQFDTGKLFSYDFSANYYSSDRASTGAFFNEGISVSGGFQTRRGRGATLSSSAGRRQQDAANLFRDRTNTLGVNWNQRALFTGGGASYGTGRQGGLPTTNLSVGQGFLVSKPLSLRTSFAQQKRGDTTTRQTSLTGTYRLDGLRTLSARVLSQNGAGGGQVVGVRKGTNAYLAYTQRSRSGGADLFVILGDPNANNTRSQVTVKLVRPY